MKTTSACAGWAGRVAAAVALIMAGALLAGCDDDDCDEEIVVEEYGVAVDSYPYGSVVPSEEYRIDVRVSTAHGAAIAGAHVDLIVSAVPEQRASALTDYDGRASFVIQTFPGVAVTAYAEAPGFSDDFVTAYTVPDSGGLGMNLVLY